MFSDGIDALSLSADLDANERKLLVEQSTKTNMVQVMILTYSKPARSPNLTTDLRKRLTLIFVWAVVFECKQMVKSNVKINKIILFLGRITQRRRVQQEAESAHTTRVSRSLDSRRSACSDRRRSHGLFEQVYTVSWFSALDNH